MSLQAMRLVKWFRNVVRDETAQGKVVGTALERIDSTRHIHIGQLYSVYSLVSFLATGC